MSPSCLAVCLTVCLSVRMSLTFLSVLFSHLPCTDPVIVPWVVGLTLLIPYLLTTNSQWQGCKLRVFAAGTKTMELDRDQRQ